MDIEIGAISLDVKNFRHAPVALERDAMRVLLADEKTHKIADLAKDIIALGSLDPSSRLIVTEDPDSPGNFIALEGNRRITALKTMMTPDIALGLPSHHLYKQLSPYFISLNIKTVDCVVLDRPSAAKWIKRKHYKGMGGEAVQQWNAVATARSDASEGIYSRWMTALAYLEDHGIEAEDLRERISRKTTSVERVLTSAHIQSTLGLSFGRDGTLHAESGDQDAAVTLVKALMEAMAENGFKETIVSSKEQQATWIAQFRHLSVKKPPEPAPDEQQQRADLDGAAGKAGASSSSGDEGQREATPTETAASDARAAPSRSKPARDREVLADKGLRISNPGLNRFYLELRKLKVAKNPFMSAALIRVFLEKATVVYLEGTGVPPLDTRESATWHMPDIKLRQKVDAALKQLDPDGADPRLAPARDVAAGNQDKLHSLNELNRWIHDHTAIPVASEILTVWNRFHPYFLALFEGLEKAGK